jgi:N-acetylneuraminic acid mutarotase
MDVPRSEMPAAVVNEQVWVLGGLTDNILGFAGSSAVEIYDPESNTWSRGPDLPAARHHAMAAVVGSEIFLLGGMEADSFTPTDTMWRLRDCVWEEMPPMPGPRAAGAAVAIDTAIYVIGGVPDGASVLRFDVENGAWTELAPLKFAREHTAATVSDDQIIVAGGRWNGVMLNSTEVYEGDRWIAGPGMLEARSGFALVATSGGLLAIGGEVFDPTRALASTEYLADNEWTNAPSLPEGLHGIPAVEVDGFVYVLGGSVRAGDVENRGEVWTLEVASIP